ncbi:MAG: hypothetical protein GF308_16500 [Candidatus Heimdallarchaeota archaeon]|nr:hypothetical protein [Candidatus Heimdallarchaeota archaeon]
MMEMAQKADVKKNISLLQSHETLVRLQAAEMLGKLLDPLAVKPLLALLEIEEEVKVRRAIVLSLSLLGAKEALPSLLDILQNDPDLETRRNVAGGLRFFSEDISSQEIVEILFQETETEIRDVLTSTLVFIRDDSIIPPLLAKFRGAAKDRHLQECCLEIIGSFNDPRAKELLISCSSEDNPESFRQISTLAMGRTDDIQFVPHLYDIYQQDPSEKIRDCAHQILEEISIALNFRSIEQMVLEFKRQEQQKQQKQQQQQTTKE